MHLAMGIRAVSVWNKSGDCKIQGRREDIYAVEWFEYKSLQSVSAGVHGGQGGRAGGILPCGRCGPGGQSCAALVGRDVYFRGEGFRDGILYGL